MPETVIPWPADVPGCIGPLSPAGGLRDNRLSFDPDSPVAPIERPATSWSPEVYQIELAPMSLDQFARFQDWYRHSLAYGVRPFAMPHPVLRTPGAWRIVRADPPYQVRKVLAMRSERARGIIVSMTIRSVPGGAPDWWALYRGEDGRMPVLVADFVAGRFGYRIGTSVVTGFGALFSFARNSTASYLDADGLIKTAASNVLRYEHDINGNRIGALIERATQNYLDRSHDFGGYWTANPAGSVNILPTAPVSPDGNATAGWRFIPSTDENGHNVQATWARNTSALVASVFARVGGYPFVTIGTNQAAAEAAVFNMNANAMSARIGAYAYAAGIIPYPSGWNRLWVSFMPRADVATETLRIKSQPEDSGSFNLSFAGNGASGTNFWGAQVELRRTGADFNGGPSAYLQTDGSSRSKTADNIAFKPALGPTDLLIAFGDGRADVQAAGVDIQPGYWPGTSLNYSGYGILSRLVGYA